MIAFLVSPTWAGAVLCLAAAGGLWVQLGYREWLEMNEGEV